LTVLKKFSKSSQKSYQKSCQTGCQKNCQKAVKFIKMLLILKIRRKKTKILKRVGGGEDQEDEGDL
jgi:hypothetical protein